MTSFKNKQIKLLILNLDMDLATKCFRDNLFSMGNSVNKNWLQDGAKSLPKDTNRIMEADEQQFPMHQNPQLGQEQNEHNQKAFQEPGLSNGRKLCTFFSVPVITCKIFLKRGMCWSYKELEHWFKYSLYNQGKESWKTTWKKYCGAVQSTKDGRRVMKISSKTW